LQVASHKPIIWRIRGLGTPKDLLGVGVSRNAPWEHHLMGGAVKHTQKHTQKTRLKSPARHLRPSVWSQAARKLWHTTNVRGATLKLKQIMKERFRLRGTQNMHLKVGLTMKGTQLHCHLDGQRTFPTGRHPVYSGRHHLFKLLRVMKRNSFCFMTPEVALTAQRPLIQSFNKSCISEP
jgi:hypothetical protein